MLRDQIKITDKSMIILKSRVPLSCLRTSWCCVLFVSRKTFTNFDFSFQSNFPEL